MAHPRKAFCASGYLNEGFTLIELSIVLVIIGLIIGGVLVGQDLISAAATRATMAQIEKYNSAANTFKVKYGYLPGDIPDPYASQFGLLARGTGAGQGDGDGNICAGGMGQSGTMGEAAMFWRDLSTVNLIEGGYSSASPSVNSWALTPTTVPNYIPLTKIGSGNYIYVWCYASESAGVWYPGGANFFSIATISQLDPNTTFTGSGLTVAQAYNIDKKMDDGLPQSGSVLALRIDSSFSAINAIWASGGGFPNMGTFTAANQGPSNAATPPTSITCYDNASGSGPQQYSMSQSNGSGPNCALSFKMQGAAR